MIRSFLNLSPYHGRGLPAALSMLLLMATISVAPAQRGGESVFAFLELAPSARIAALGGSMIAVRDSDPALGLHNPGALNAEMHQSMTFQYHFLFDGIGDGYAAYAQHFPEQEITAHAGVQFIRYGSFEHTDAFGNRLGTFTAHELALTAGAAKQVSERLSAGANLRFVQSRMESYGASALLFDVGGTYYDPERQLTLAVALRNAGFQLSAYEDDFEPVPVNLQIGLSKRLQYLPFRLSVTADHLHRWDLLYDSPLDQGQAIVIGEGMREQSAFWRNVDNAFRHLIFGGEFLIGENENLHLRFGYNHRRRKEMTVGTLRSFAGFSLGAGIRIKQFSVDFGLSSYHIAGSTKHIGISTNLARFRNGILD